MATTSDVVNVDEVADLVEAGASDLSCRPHDARQVANAIRVATVRRPNTRIHGGHPPSWLTAGRRPFMRNRTRGASATGRREPIQVAAAVRTMIVEQRTDHQREKPGQGREDRCETPACVDRDSTSDAEEYSHERGTQLGQRQAGRDLHRCSAERTDQCGGAPTSSAVAQAMITALTAARITSITETIARACTTRGPNDQPGVRRCQAGRMAAR